MNQAYIPSNKKNPKNQDFMIHSLLYIRPDSKSTMDAIIADLLKMISINIRVN